jgi:hypothetical protein
MPPASRGRSGWPAGVATSSRMSTLGGRWVVACARSRLAIRARGRVPPRRGTAARRAPGSGSQPCAGTFGRNGQRPAGHFAPRESVHLSFERPWSDGTRAWRREGAGRSLDPLRTWSEDEPIARERLVGRFSCTMPQFAAHGSVPALLGAMTRRRLCAKEQPP